MVHRPARLLLVLLRTGRLYAGFLGRWCGTNQQIEEAVRGRARPGSNQQRHWLVWAAAGGSAHCLPPLTLWQRRSCCRTVTYEMCSTHLLLGSAWLQQG